ncbi:MAG TPA: hemolysin family protein [Bryobacteraceae bacterium]|jgi:putative hemolysin|nr:hemolysin family protein [Bryobacteraceae bacterium]
MAYRFVILAAVLLLNGFFATAEVALVSVRKSRLRALAEEGQVGAQAALALLANPSRLLSMTQAGVTLASLGLGWAGENSVYELLESAFHPLITPRFAVFWHGGSFAIAFLLISYAHIVFGEVVPKNLAIEKADRLAILVAPALLVFSRVSSPLLFFAERSAATVSRWIGLRGGHGGGGHSAEELKFIVSSSRTEGHLHRFEEDAIQALLELPNYYAREIMVPRNAIVSVSVDASLDQVLRRMREHEYSRLPVYEGSPEHIIGYVHYKDMMRIWEERRIANARKRALRPFHLSRVLRKPLVVPETKPLHDLIEEFRTTHTHMAIVVDEFGTIVGLVTLEDALEQIFGEIGDEHDVKRPRPAAEAPLIEVDGAITIRDLDTQYGLELPGDAGFETLAGFLLFQLGYIPKPGDALKYGGRKFTILGMDHNRISRVGIERLAEPPAAQPGPAKAG